MHAAAAAAMPSRCWSRLQSPYSSRANTQLTPRLLSVLFLFGMPLLWLLPFHGGKNRSLSGLPAVFLLGFASVISLPVRVELSCPRPARCPRVSSPVDDHQLECRCLYKCVLFKARGHMSSALSGAHLGLGGGRKGYQFVDPSRGCLTTRPIASL